jgi:hypothetical protein
VGETALPILEAHAKATGADATIRVEDETIYVDYDQLAKGTGYVTPWVQLEFGARSTGEPAEIKSVTCDAAQHLPEVDLPDASPRIMLPKKEPSGRKQRRSMSSASRARPAIESRAIGTIWCGSTTRGLRRLPFPKHSQTLPNNSRPLLASTSACCGTS